MVIPHYGDPYREQRAAAERCGVADRGDRGVVRVSGPDRLSWLHSLTTQHLTDLRPWTGTEALVLSPHGHVEHDLQLADDGETTWIDVEPGTAAGLVGFLDSMRFLLRVDVADVTGEWAVLSVTGPAAAEVVPVPDAAAPRLEGGLLRQMPWPLADSVDLLVPRATRQEAWDALVAAGAAPLGELGWEALRVAARRPRLGWETDHRTIPHEVGWLESAVHLDKGCYRGQETVARVHNLGRPPRRLVLLHLDGSDSELPAHGDPVEWSGTTVGFVGTAVRHHELGPLVLAVVKRNTPDDAPLTAGAVPAAIDPAPARGSPDQPR